MALPKFEQMITETRVQYPNVDELEVKKFAFMNCVCVMDAFNGYMYASRIFKNYPEMEAIMAHSIMFSKKAVHESITFKNRMITHNRVSKRRALWLR